MSVVITVGNINYLFLKTPEKWHTAAGRVVKWGNHFGKLLVSF